LKRAELKGISESLMSLEKGRIAFEQFALNCHVFELITCQPFFLLEIIHCKTIVSDIFLISILIKILITRAVSFSETE
jgi:hypothetical protein